MSILYPYHNKNMSIMSILCSKYIQAISLFPTGLSQRYNGSDLVAYRRGQTDICRSLRGKISISTPRLVRSTR